MKNPINSTTSKLGSLSQIKILTLAVLLIVPAATVFGQSFWSGGTSDYNNPASWSGSYNSGNPNCCNDSGTNNIVLIQTGDPAWIHGDTLAGQGSGASGSYLQTGSTNGTGYPGNGNWMRLGIGGGGTVGYYTLSNGVVNVAGQTHLGENGTGVLTIAGGIYTTGYNGNPGICAGDGDFGPSTGTLNISGGSITNISNETWFGEQGGGGSGTGYLNMTGGTINTFNWFVFGRNGGTGVGTMSGGSITESGGGNFLVGGGGSGTLTQSGGSIYVLNGCQFLCPQSGGPGNYNLSGTGYLEVHNWFVVGRSGGEGLLNMTGGTINIDSGDSGGNFEVCEGDNADSTGTVNQSGGTVNVSGDTQSWIGQTSGSTGPGTYNLSGTGIVNADGWWAIGRDGGTGYMNVSGGSFTQTAGPQGGHLDVGSGGGGGSGTLTQTGGTITALANSGQYNPASQSESDASNPTFQGVWIGEQTQGTWNMNLGNAYVSQVVLGVSGSGYGTLNLNGGLFQTFGISQGSGLGQLYFNGGTLQAGENNTTFIAGLYSAQLQAGGVVVDSQNYDVTVPQQLTDGGGGGLTKISSGTLTLTGANSYIGATVVNGGTLATTTASQASSSTGYTVNNGSTFGVQVASPGSQLATSSVDFDSHPDTLVIDLNTFGIPSEAPLSVGTLTVNGTVTINVLSSTPLATGPVPLVAYSSASGSGTFVLGSIPIGEVGHLVNNGSLISLDITSAGAPSWNGNVAGQVWDINNTQNWIDLITTEPTVYNNGEPVLFSDNAQNTTVNLGITVTPGSVTFDNTQYPYTLNGNGSISGATGLVLNGANTVSLNLANDSYTGPTVLNDGTLAVTTLANGSSPSAIGESSASPTNLVLNGGTLSYSGAAETINRGYDLQDTNGAIDISTIGNLTLTGSVIAGPESGFTKGGAAQLAYDFVGSNTLSGSAGYTVAQGTVLFDGVGNGQTNNIAGNFAIGVGGSTNAAVVLSNNTTVDVVTGGLVDVADGQGAGSTGSLSVTGGTFNAGDGQIWVGQSGNSVGELNISGGTFIANNWLAIGRGASGNPGVGGGGGSGVGTLNLSGGVLQFTAIYGGNLDIGNSGGNAGVFGTGTLNQTGGAITNTASQTWLGEGSGGQPASGTWNMSGGTAVLGELHIGVGGTGTSTLNISGSANITESYLLLANYDGDTTGNVNIGSASQPGGTITVNADMDIGGQGTGTLNFVTNGGGELTVTGTIYLSRFSQTADGTVNLNAGGTLVAGYINNGWGFQNNYPTPTSNPNAFNFNGGTLQAYTGSGFFIQPYVNAVVQAGGAIINDGGFNIAVLTGLVTDGVSAGGLTKLGNGTLYMDGASTYTGPTLVSQGTMGGTGSVVSAVTVASGATIAVDSGIQFPSTFTINNALSLSAGSTTSMEISQSANDQFVVSGGVTYGGDLVVNNNSGSPLAVGNTYQLFNNGGSYSGNFSSVTVLPDGLGTFNPANGVLTIVAFTPPVVNPPIYSGGVMTVTGTGGTPNAAYTLLSSTNLVIPLADWKTYSTGVLNGSGGFSISIPVTNSVPAIFFQVQVP